MEYRSVGKSGLKVSEIAVGSWMTDLAGSEKADVAEQTIRLPMIAASISLTAPMATAAGRRNASLEGC